MLKRKPYNAWVIKHSRWLVNQFKDVNGTQRIMATRWKIKSWNKFRSPCKAELDSWLEKDQVISKWLWFPNTPGICLNSPRILEMLSLDLLLTTGLRTSTPSNQGSREAPSTYQSIKDGHLCRSVSQDKVPMCLWDRTPWSPGVLNEILGK